jgi:hypothetical protein
MATTLTKYLQLKVADDLSADAKYNLGKIDSLGASIGSAFAGTGDLLSILSRGNIELIAEAPSIGGSGQSGTITLGDTDNEVGVVIHSTDFFLRSTLSLLNQSSTAGTVNYLKLKFLNNTDILTSRTLTIDVGNSNKSISFLVDGPVVTTTGIQTLVDKDITGVFTGPLTGNVTGNASGTASNVTGIVAVVNGGTGASVASAAAENLLPTYSGNGDKVLSLNSAGTALEWKAAGVGQVVGITATPGTPITISEASPNPVIGITLASSSSDGYLSSFDWQFFYNKEPYLGISNSTTYLRGDRQWSTLNVAAVSGLQSALDTKYGANNPDGFVNAAGAAAAAPVQSVNGQTNIVSLSTTNIGEGTNLYFTDLRAKTAAVVNSTAGTETDQAPSVSAVKAYVTAQGGGSVAYTWSTADGATKSITHSLNKTTITVTIYDENGEDILVDTIDRTDNNNLSLAASVAPTGNWTVIIRP